MILYRLLDTEEAKFYSKSGIIGAFAFYVIGGILFLVLNGVVRLALSGLFFSAAIIATFAGIRDRQIFGRYAVLEDGVLTVCTRKGRTLRNYSLEKMDSVHAFVYYGGRDFEKDCEKSFVLYPRGMVFVKQMVKKDGECLQRFSARAFDRKKMVFIINKALEEKILAYYEEKPIVDQEQQ